jgi:hypothetical protein
MRNKIKEKRENKGEIVGMIINHLNNNTCSDPSGSEMEQVGPSDWLGQVRV